MMAQEAPPLLWEVRFQMDVEVSLPFDKSRFPASHLYLNLPLRTGTLNRVRPGHTLGLLPGL